ncbi:MAG: FkbM family methyltransferase [Thermonemataceae bacterium]
MKIFKRLFNLYKVCSLKEFFYILYHFFITKQLVINNPVLHRVLIFVIACTDKNYLLSLQEGNIIQIEGLPHGAKFLVRKYTRDLLVFEGFFISDDYTSYIEEIQTSSSKVNLVIDAGANIGCSCIFFQVFFPHSTIICIEPELSNYSMLQKNINLNRINDKVKVYRKALWNEKTTLALRRIDYSNDGFHTMVEGTTDEVIDSVATCTIPEILDDLQVAVVDVLKIDIEGAEKTLFNDQAHLHSFLPQVRYCIMEVHNEYISDKQIEMSFKEFGFHTKTITLTGQPSAIVAHKY